MGVARRLRHYYSTNGRRSTPTHITITITTATATTTVTTTTTATTTTTTTTNRTTTNRTATTTLLMGVAQRPLSLSYSTNGRRSKGL